MPQLSGHNFIAGGRSAAGSVLLHSVDASTGSIQHMSAELRIDGQVQRGCGYFGGSRND